MFRLRKSASPPNFINKRMKIMTSQKKKNYRKLWIPELIILLILTLAVVILFRDNSLDLRFAHFFYHPENIKDPWFEAHDLLWNFFYHAAPWFTGALLLGSLSVLLLAQFKPEFKKLRVYAIYVLLTVMLGPGLMVNSIFKPYWGRPRPREVIELGGRYEYRTFYTPAFGQPGKSFPCGHCSVGFTFTIFWWIFRRRNLRLGITSLLGSVVLGTAMGIGRMADGGHFLSDVFWAALMTWFSGFWLYYFVLKIPQREDQLYTASPKLAWMTQFFDRKKGLSYILYILLAIFTVTTLLLASPFYKDLQYSEPKSRIDNLLINVDHGDVEFNMAPLLDASFSFAGSAKGFGFPGNHVDLDCASSKQLTLCSLNRHGFFSDYETNIKIFVNPKFVTNLILNVQKGGLTTPNTKELPSTYQLHLGKKNNQP